MDSSFRNSRPQRSPARIHHLNPITITTWHGQITTKKQQMPSKEAKRRDGQRSADALVSAQSRFDWTGMEIGSKMKGTLGSKYGVFQWVWDWFKDVRHLLYRIWSVCGFRARSKISWTSQ